jgi:prevent-host-death family protein
LSETRLPATTSTELINQFRFIEIVVAPRAKTVLSVIPALTARTQLGQILRRVRSNNERFVVDRRGEPQAVIMSIEEYLRTIAKASASLKKLRRMAKARKTDSLSLREINLEIKRYRRERRAKNT